MNLVAELATKAWNEKLQFIDVLFENGAVASRVSIETLNELTDPLKYIGQSKEIIQEVARLYHKKKTFEEVHG